MAFSAYLLRCGDGSFYAGHYEDLEARIGAHRSGRGSDYTARRQPVSFAWAQDFPSRLEALAAERRVKGWSRAKKEAMIAGDRDRVAELAKARGTGPSTGSGRTEKRSGSTASPMRAEPADARVSNAVLEQQTHLRPFPRAGGEI